MRNSESVGPLNRILKISIFTRVKSSNLPSKNKEVVVGSLKLPLYALKKCHAFACKYTTLICCRENCTMETKD
jgi:hypothetical protein